MTSKLLLVFGTLALALASAKTYNLTLLKPAVVAGQELKAGDYKIAVDDTKVVLTKGKVSVESPVKVEKADSKFSSTAVRYANDGGKFRVEEIRLGGTNLRLVFN
jgi:hypothetical protein